MKGIILSGGTGSRLYPMTVSVNKQLIPVYDKPMIYYPLANLISFGIKEICIISSSDFIDSYKKLFNDGSHLGLDICYKIQPEPKGIAQALIIAYGVVNFDLYGNPISMEEKPLFPSSKYAMPGLYFYDANATEYAKTLIPSDRGELEIIDLNKIYLKKQDITVIKLKKGTVWLDAGTPESLYQSSAYIQTIQSRQGTMIGNIEEECFKRCFIDKNSLINLIYKMPNSEYRSYLLNLTSNV